MTKINSILNIKNKSSRERINIVIIFLILYLSSSFVAINSNGTIVLSLMILTTIIALIVNFYYAKINIFSTKLVGIVFVLSILTMIINKESVYDYLIFWIALMCSLLISFSIRFDDFVNYFIKIMYFIAFFSIVALLIQYLFPSLIQLFPVFESSSGVVVYNLFFTVLYDTDYIKMNPGFFWEPGAYQTLLLFSMIFILFYRKKINYKYLIVHSIALISTFSTMAYIGLALFALIYIFRDGISIKKVMSVLCFFILGLIFISFLPYNIQFKIYGKFKIFLDWENLVNNPIFHSTVSRVQGVLFPIKGFLKNPLFGVGITNLSNYATIEGYGHLTSTQLNWFGYFGILIGLIMNFPLLRISIQTGKSKGIIFLIFILVNMIIISQNYNRNSFIILIIIYGMTCINKYNDDFQGDLVIECEEDE